MNTIMYLPALAREYLFPAGCPICGKDLLDAKEARYGLCQDCMPRFRIDEQERCDTCGRPLISEQGRCLACRSGEARNLDGVWALYPYHGIYRRLLRAYKFGHSRALGHFFAEKLIECLARGPACFQAAAGAAPLERPCLVPAPPRPGKIRRAGWDQVDYLANLLRRLYRTSGSARWEGGPLPVYPCLKRLPSQSQKELDRENRKRNLQGRIVCARRPPAEVILFDDVITTGSTLDACAAALRAKGTQKIYGLCLFYD
jgi:ComF family protein